MQGLEDAYTRFEQNMGWRIGSYAKTVIYHSAQDHVCPLCGGPKKTGTTICYSCARLYDEARQLGVEPLMADCVRIANYAIKFDQMYKVMDGYKRNLPEAKEYQETLKYVLGDALVIHWQCLGRVSDGSAPTAWATMPSTKSSERYGRPHPLNRLVSSLLGRTMIPEIVLVANSDKTREIAPGTFSLAHERRADVLRHVLLIDDTWTSGGTVESAAVMLKQQGAQRGTIFCLARIIDYGFCSRMVSPEVADAYMQLPYRLTCPWGLGRHQLVDSH